MNRNMRKIQRATAAVLAAVMAASTLSVSIASAPEVTTEETAYITLDQYGEQTDVSIVKAVDLNGNTGFTDYGRYESVVNMSTGDQPQITDEGVEWDLRSAGKDRFYYQVKTRDGTMDIPWTIDVSYSLNGVPTAAEELAGKSGLVAIDVTVTPNDLVDEYYKNNFVLLCGALSDSSSDYSFSAPGAQLQSLGRYRVAVFMAMPREERTFHLEIGSDEFEFSGLIFASMPVTLAQAEDISEIAQDKEDIETLWDSTNSMLDDVLSIMTSMTAGTAQTAEGLRELDQARAEFDTEYESIRDKVYSTRYSMKQLKNHLYDLADILDDAEILDSIGRVEDNIDDMLTRLEKLGEAMEAIEEITSQIQEICEQLSTTPGLPPETQQELIGKLKALIEQLNAILGQMGQMDELAFGAEIAKLQEALEGIDQGLETGSLNAQALQAVLEGMKEVGDQVNTTLEESRKNIENIESITPTGNISGDLGDLISEADIINSELALVLDNTARTVSKLDVLMAEFDKAVDGSYEHLNGGMETTLNGTAELLESLTVALQRTQNIQYNKNQISDIISKDWDKLNDELGILDIDPSARKLSFTSARNPEPASLQIVMRTESITIPDAGKADVDEGSEEKTITQRLGDVFISIGNSIKNLFQ